MKGSELIFDSTDLLYYKLHKISLNRRGSYTDSLKWLKNKTAKIKCKNTIDMTCFNCCIKLSKQKKNPERLTKIKVFINHYKWKEINIQ